jgi:GNAT superfamily N-acetyltransferase
VVRAIQESFQDHFGYVVRPFDEELELLRHEINDLPNFDQRLWFLAIDGEEIAGIALCFPCAWDDPDVGWVGTLGVRRPWRRRGLGEALLRHAFLEFRKLGKRRAGLAVDSQNLTGATRLYEKVGLRSVPSRQYDLYEKELRTGKELSVISLDY